MSPIGPRLVLRMIPISDVSLNDLQYAMAEGAFLSDSGGIYEKVSCAMEMLLG